MEDYLSMVLAPDLYPVVPIPDCFLNPVSTFKSTWSTQIKSSAARGNVLGVVTCTAYCSTSTQFIAYYTDGAGVLDVTNLPSPATLTANGTNGRTLTGYLWQRISALKVKLTPIASELSSSGSLVICTSNQSLVTTGVNVYDTANTFYYSAKGKGDGIFEAIYLPGDYTDFEYRSSSDTADADKATTWNTIIIAGMGFPLDTFVYTLDVTVCVDAVVTYNFLNLIPSELSPVGSIEELLLRLKTIVLSDKRYVCRAEKPIYS